MRQAERVSVFYPPQIYSGPSLLLRKAGGTIRKFREPIRAM